MTGAKLKEAIELMRSLMKQYPKASEEELAERFAAEIRTDEAMFKAIVEDAFHLISREIGKGGSVN